MSVSHKSGGKRSNRDASEEIANERRQPQLDGKKTAEKSEGEADRDSGNERSLVRHGKGLLRDTREEIWIWHEPFFWPETDEIRCARRQWRSLLKTSS